MYTKEDIKYKVCPNKFGPDNESWNCYGEDCMAWRWDSRSKHDGGFPGSELPKEKWKGYCGLGGKP